MKATFLSLLLMLVLLLSCGSLQSTTHESQVSEKKGVLPPDVPSNKYARGRN